MFLETNVIFAHYLIPLNENMKHHSKQLSIVIPVYKAEGMVKLLVNRIVDSVSKITSSFEIILVEDGSPDNSWNEIIEMCSIDSRVKGIKLSRNFGQHNAITAGLFNSNGEWIVVMDCDLQDQPEEIPKLYSKALEGFDIVYAQRIKRIDSAIKRFSSSFFHLIFGYLTNTKSDNTVANYGIYHSKAINAILAMGDTVRSLYMLSKWIGFRTAYIPVKHAERSIGFTSYNFTRLLKLSFDIILSFSTKPLRLILTFGAVIICMSVCIGVYYLTLYLFGDILVSGYTSIILSIWFLAGSIIVTMGVIGLYIEKIFEKVKDRPSFIIQESLNLSTTP
jgi:glycosyltransferase involved in cell wall biosynthesis